MHHVINCGSLGGDEMHTPATVQPAAALTVSLLHLIHKRHSSHSRLPEYINTTNTIDLSSDLGQPQQNKLFVFDPI